MSTQHSISVTEAQSIILDVPKTPLRDLIPIHEARNRILGQEMAALLSLPPTDKSLLDGYALNLGEPPYKSRYRVVTESSAGHPTNRAFEVGECARISTGAVLPDSAQAVIAQEKVHRVQDCIEIEQEFANQLQPGQFILKAGSDIVTNESLAIEPGHRLGPGEIALLAACGHTQVPVFRKPTVAILSTGDELAPIGSELGPGQIFSTNGLMLAGQILDAGAEVLSCVDIGDNEQDLENALSAACEADIILTSGGISVGDHDKVFPTLVRLGFDCKFRQVRLRPGKPTTFGNLGETLVFALPGNPASSYVACELFVRPLIQKLLGRNKSAWFRPQRQVKLSSNIRADQQRSHFLRAIVSNQSAQPLAHQLSGALTSLAGHNALIGIPPNADIMAGDLVWALMLVDHL